VIASINQLLYTHGNRQKQEELYRKIFESIKGLTEPILNGLSKVYQETDVSESERKEKLMQWKAPWLGHCDNNHYWETSSTIDRCPECGLAASGHTQAKPSLKKAISRLEAEGYRKAVPGSSSEEGS